MVPHALGQHGEFCLAMIVAAALAIQFGNQDTGDVMLLVGLVHHVLSELLAHRRVEDFLLDGGMDLKLGERLADDLLLAGA